MLSTNFMTETVQPSINQSVYKRNNLPDFTAILRLIAEKNGTLNLNIPTLPLLPQV